MDHVFTCPFCGKTARMSAEALLPIRCTCGTVCTDRSSIRPLALVPKVIRGVRWARATARWIAAGCPTRTDDEVRRLLAAHCARCEWFSGVSCTHRRCGCQLRSPEADADFGVAAALVNKLRMGTEACPDNRWGAVSS